MSERCPECGHEAEHITRETSVEAERSGVPYLRWTSCRECKLRRDLCNQIDMVTDPATRVRS